MPLRDWVSSEFVDDGNPDVEAFLTELGAMLDTHQPTNLAPERSHVTPHEDGIKLTLAHRETGDGDITVLLSYGEATIMWAHTHEHVRREDVDEGDARRWTSLVTDMIATTLRGEVLFEVTHRGRTWVKTQIIRVDEGREQVVGTTGSLRGWLIRWRPAHVVRQQIDYGVAVSDA